MIPNWIKEHIDHNCPYCGSPMEELYNSDGKCTNRRCTNYMQCPGHNAQKGAFMFKLFGVEGIGAARCLELINIYKYVTHIQLVVHVPESNRKQKLSTILRALCLDGIDREWITVCERNGVVALTDLPKLPQEYLDIIDAAATPIKYLIQNLELDLTGYGEDLAKEYQYIMITDRVYGYATKEDFIDFLNKKYGKYIRTFHQVTVKKGGVAALIKEPTTNTMTKYTAAKQAGIPIYTSENFLKYMDEKYVNKNDEAAAKIEHE